MNLTPVPALSRSLRRHGRNGRPRLLVLATALALVLSLATALRSAGPAAAAGTLLSQGNTATASSIENAGTPASAAVDGNTGTRWSSAFSDPQWLAGRPRRQRTRRTGRAQLGGRLRHGVPDPDLQRRHQLDLDLLHHHRHRRHPDAERHRHRPLRPDVRHRPRRPQYGYSLWEFQVYGTAGAPAAAAAPTNAALSKPATASSTENAGTPASAAVDGNTGTRWSSAFSDPQWLQVDLGSHASRSARSSLNWEAAYAKAFQIQTSTDGADLDRRSTPPPPAPAAPRRSTSPAPAATSGCTAPPAAPATATRSGSSRSSPAAAARPRRAAGCTGQSDTPNFGPNVHVFDPSHVQRARIQASSTPSSTPAGQPDRAVRHPAGTPLLFKPGTYSVNANVGFYTSVAGPRPEPRRRHHQRRRHGRRLQRLDAGNATQNFWRSAENLADQPDRRQRPLGRRAGGAVPPHATSTAACSSTRPATAGPAAATSPTPRSPARSSVVLPAAVVHPGQQLRQLERRRLEHGVLRRDRRAGRRASRTRR